MTVRGEFSPGGVRSDLVWSIRSTSRDDEERYRIRTTDRLRRVAASVVDARDMDSEQLRTRFDRMHIGAVGMPTTPKMVA
jgi:hypothetical protein